MRAHVDADCHFTLAGITRWLGQLAMITKGTPQAATFHEKRGMQLHSHCMSGEIAANAAEVVAGYCLIGDGSLSGRKVTHRASR